MFDLNEHKKSAEELIHTLRKVDQDHIKAQTAFHALAEVFVFLFDVLKLVVLRSETIQIQYR